MIIKNLELSFVKQEGDKIILQSEAGAEIALTDYLLAGWKDRSAKVYLNLDSQPLTASSDQSKKLLNELLGHEEK